MLSQLLAAVLLSLICSGASHWRPTLFQIQPTAYDELVHYTKYSSAVYQKVCPRPLGNHLVAQFAELVTNVNGLVVRDEGRKEIVVVFRGTDALVLADYLTDSQLSLTPYNSPGVEGVPNGTEVHSGFLNSYNAVASMVISITSSQFELYPDYDLVCTGHSMGGALAALAALSLRHNLPNITGSIRLFTFGQPRTGDVNWSRFLEDSLGVESIFRVVHMHDGVPTIIPRYLGYHHHATEYWQIGEPANPENVRKCINSSEDPDCSRSIRSAGINVDHFTYLDHVMTLEPWLCI